MARLKTFRREVSSKLSSKLVECDNDNNNEECNGGDDDIGDNDDGGNDDGYNDVVSLTQILIEMESTN